MTRLLVPQCHGGVDEGPAEAELTSREPPLVFSPLPTAFPKADPAKWVALLYARVPLCQVICESQVAFRELSRADRNLARAACQVGRGVIPAFDQFTLANELFAGRAAGLAASAVVIGTTSTAPR